MKKTSLLEEASRVSSMTHPEAGGIHILSIQKGISQLAENSAVFWRDLITMSQNLVHKGEHQNITVLTSTDLAQQIYLNKCKTAPYNYTSSAY